MVFQGTGLGSQDSSTRLIAASGVSDLIVVDEPDALLICHRDKAQSVKQIVERLKQEGREDLL